MRRDNDKQPATTQVEEHKKSPVFESGLCSLLCFIFTLIRKSLSTSLDCALKMTLFIQLMIEDICHFGLGTKELR